MFASIIKRNESELETEKKERLWFEEKCQKLELELKKLTTQRLEEQQQLTTILKQKEIEFETERKERLWLEENCEKLELELKKLTIEKSNEIQLLQEKLGMHMRPIFENADE